MQPGSFTRTVFLLAILGLASCRSLPASQQARVSKPNMVFSDNAAFGDRGALAGQIEPGASATGGAQAAGCTSCK